MTSFFTHWLTLLSTQVLLRFTLHPRHSSTKFLLKTKCRIQETMFAAKFINRSVLMRNWKYSSRSDACLQTNCLYDVDKNVPLIRKFYNDKGDTLYFCIQYLWKSKCHSLCETDMIWTLINQMLFIQTVVTCFYMIMSLSNCQRTMLCTVQGVH